MKKLITTEEIQSKNFEQKEKVFYIIFCILELINEFHVIYIKSPDIYKKYANEEERVCIFFSFFNFLFIFYILQKICQILREKSSTYINLLEKESVSLALTKPGGFVPPSPNTDTQISTGPAHFSFTTPPSSYPYSSMNQTSQSLKIGKILLIVILREKYIYLDTNIKSEQDNTSTGTKRPHDSTNADKACKRSSSFLQQQEKK